MRVALLAVALVGCVDTADPRAPMDCAGIEALTKTAPDVAQVKLPGKVRTSGEQTICKSDDGATKWTWTSDARLLDGALGSYGVTSASSPLCVWVDAIDSRTKTEVGCD